MKRLVSWLLIAVMLLGLVPAALAEEAAADATVIDFEDGAFGFLGLSTAKGNADASALSVVDYEGSKALKIVPQGKVPYIAFNLDGLLGDRIADVRAISADYGVDTAPDGKFYAISGKVYAYTDEENDESSYDWSVYLTNKNPRTIVTKLDEDKVFAPGLGNSLVISRETDNYQTASDEPLAFYLDNIRFLDADGNALPLELSAQYAAADTGRDLSNLAVLKNPVEFEGFSGITGGGWSQNGLPMTEEFRAALTPGSVIEIEYESADGSMWIVLPDDGKWSRIGDGGKAAVNNSHTIAQIPFEMIAEVDGEDASAWGERLQCEAASDWTVYAVRVGQRANRITLQNPVEFEGFTTSGSGWSQNGFDIPDDFRAALVPGSVIEISFASEDGSMWLVLPDDGQWSRIGDGGQALIVGDKAYIPFEMIAAISGDDPAAWGARLQCEAATDWEVYSVRVGQAAEFEMLTNLVEFPGFTTSGGGWSQNGFDIPDDFRAALTPGSVITISYASDDDSMWIVLPDDGKWSRIGDGGAAVTDGSTAQIPFEMIAAISGDDPAAWGGRLQCEAATDWEVYSVAVGQAVK